MYLTGAKIVVEELIRHGVENVFGYPGGYVIDIYDEIYKNAHRITHILTAHEQGAAHAADAYARVTGKTSAVLATSGPGATNLVTGIANAYLDSSPVVFITGNVPVPMLGQDSFQEIDIVGVTMPIVKHSFVVRDVSMLQQTLREAFRIAGSGRKGPVLVDIPKCVQQGTCNYDITFEPKPPLARPQSTAHDLSGAAEAIGKSERPCIYCGGGVTASDTGNSVAELSKLLGAPVAASMMGIGCVPRSYELCLGMSGIHGNDAAITAMAEADLIIALGARFSDRASAGTNGAAIIHIDIDAAEIGKNVRTDISICGDLRDIMPKLSRAVQPKHNQQWHERVRALIAADSAPHSPQFDPRSIIEHVGRFYDADTVVATDVGQHQMWAAQFYRFEKPRKLITSGGLGAMGFGLGAAIGASIARNRKRTVLLTSDGSFGMNLTELATAVTQKLPLTIVILNNGALGMVRQMQSQFFDGRYCATTLERKTDFPALANAFGARGFAAATLLELDRALVAAADDGPSVIDCTIGMNEKVLPMVAPGGVLY